MEPEKLGADKTANPILDSYEDYGCKVNSLSPNQLFQKYEIAGFLYPAKMALLSPYLDIVKENWRRGLRGGELILWFNTFDDPNAGAWASLSSWRSTLNGWNTQHLVGLGSPLAVRAVMLAGQAVRIKDGLDRSHQNWFRPQNRFPNKVFGSLVDTIGPEYAAVSTFNYLAVSLPIKASEGAKVYVKECKNSHCSELLTLATNSRGNVYVSAEELTQDDLLLDGVDQLYQRVGLRRYRRVWLAFLPNREEAVGAAIVYRGPLGFNFSFLENRCDIINDKTLTGEEVRTVSWELLRAASAAYADFLPKAIPVVADDNVTSCLVSQGASLMRQYAQSIWLKDGFVGWYRHVEKFYERIIRAQKRTGLAGHLQKGAAPQPSATIVGDQGTQFNV